MKYKTLVIERSFHGRKYNKPLTLRVPEGQNRAEKKLLQYILESLSSRSRLVPFTLDNLSTMKVARHLLFNRTASPSTLLGYMDNYDCFCRWTGAEPDKLVNSCRNKDGDVNPKGIARMRNALGEYIDQLQTKNLAPTTVAGHLKSITNIFRINDVELKLPYGLRIYSSRDGRAPSREELIRILDLTDLRERVIVTMLAVSGLRVGTLLKLQYRHVKGDLERGIIPVHIHVEAELTKGKRCSYDTFLNDEASECLKAYLDARRAGTKKIPPEQICDESPLIKAQRCRQVRTIAVTRISSAIHDLFVRAGLREKNSYRKCELTTHSLRRFFRTQMASLDVDPDCIDFMMGHVVKDRYHDVRMKGVEYLRGVYMTSGIRIRPRMKMNKIEALKEILQTWGLNPQKILTHEALALITPTTKQEKVDNIDAYITSRSSRSRQLRGSLQKSTGGHT